MNHTLMAAAVGMVALLIADWRWSRHKWWAACGATGMVLAPVGALFAIGAGFALVRARRWRAARSRSRLADADVGLMARSVLISVAAGMPLPAALELAASQVEEDLAAEIRALLRQGRRTGLGKALGEARGRGARLYVLLARAQTTGASISGAVAAFVDERRQADRAHALEAARRLPVKLTIPLALLILPGFVALTVGPSVLSTARRMFGPILPLP